MLFTHSNVASIPISVSIGDTVIERTQSTKFLGVIIDDRLNYKEHVLQLSKKLSRVSGIMRRISNFMSPLVLNQVYFSLFQSFMDYGLAIWGGSGVTNRSKIIQVQRKALELFLDLPNNVPQPLIYEKLYEFRIVGQFHKYMF